MHGITRKKLGGGQLSMKTKLILGLGSIAAMLLLSSVISVLEFRRMSTYVSDQVAANIRNINAAQKLASKSDEYNLKMLAAIGDDEGGKLPDFDRAAFLDSCDSLRNSLTSKKANPITDSVVYAYTAYMLTSLEFEQVMMSDFINSREWYFERLQPRYQRLRSDIEKLTAVAYDELHANSLTFQQSFYRSIIPGIVSVGAGLILIALLYFFISAYYVRPIYKMLASLKNYGLTGGSYNCTFDGTDQLAELNGELKEVVDENVELRRRNKYLKDERDRMIEAVESVQE